MQWKPWKFAVFLTGVIFASYMTLILVIPFAVQHARASAYDGPGKPEAPSKSLLAFHWLMYISALIIAVGMMIVPVTFWTLIMSGVFGVFLFLFWILNMIWFFKSHHYKQDYQLMDPSAFNDMNELGISRPAWIGISGRASGGTGKGSWSCRTSSVYIHLVNSTDESTPLNLTSDIVGENGKHVVTAINLNIRSGNEYVEAAKSAVMACLKGEIEPDARHYYVDTETVITDYVSQVTVTPDGAPSKAINKAAAQAAAVFGPAIAYSYEIARKIPTIEYSIVKTADVDPNWEFPCSALKKCYSIK